MSPAPSLPEGTLVKGYRLGRCLGQGAMGEVYAARHETIGRRVALKILRQGVEGALNGARRMLEEARAVNVIAHPGIVQVFDVGLMDQRRPYLVMELLEGRPLSARLKEGPLPAPQATAILERVLSALGAAHRAGVIHRDLKPSNVFLTGGDRGVKLVDFGVARREGRAEVLTAMETTVGSLGFMAPEQLRGSPVPASDLYAVGCLAFLMLTGRPVFPVRSVPENARLHLFEPAPRVRSLRPELSDRLEVWVSRLLAKAPESRPATADAALADLQAATVDRSNSRTELVPAFTPPSTARTRVHSRLVTVRGGDALRQREAEETVSDR